MGYIKRLADKRYRIKYDVPRTFGKRRVQRTETLRGVTKKEAEAILAQRKAQISSGEYLHGNMTVSTLFEAFMSAKRMGKRSPSTIERYGTLYTTYVKPRFGLVLLKDLTQQHLANAYAAWSIKGKSGRALSARTVRHVHDLIRAMLNYAIRRNLINRNVALCVSEDLPRAQKPESVALTESQLKRLLSSAENPTTWAKKRGVISAQPWFAPAVWFAAYTGARRGETLAMRWSDLNLDQATATVCRAIVQTRDTLQYKATKNGKPRVIVLPATLVGVLRRHRQNQEGERATLGEAYHDEDLVFAMADGSPVSPWTFTASFRYLVERAGVPYIRLHDLRDTHASLLAKHGVPLEVVSKRLGHSTIGITADRYLHVYHERDADAADVFERLAS